MCSNYHMQIRHHIQSANPSRSFVVCFGISPNPDLKCIWLSYADESMPLCVVLIAATVQSIIRNNYRQRENEFISVVA